MLSLLLIFFEKVKMKQLFPENGFYVFTALLQ